MSTIILTGGGTAGHVTPHLAILPYLKNNFDNIIYFGSENGIEKNIINNVNLPYYSIPCAKLNRSFNVNNIKIPFALIKGIKIAGKLLDQIKPKVIFSKGGFVSVPTVIAAGKRKIPVITHESDYTIGLANKICAKYSTKILTSFDETAKTISKGECVGPPLRKNLFEKFTDSDFKIFGFKEKKPVILVTGGSQGAYAINNLVWESLDELLKNYNVIHLCGKNNLNKQKEQIGYYQAEYLNNIEVAFNCADICVSRAGSNTLFELLAIKKPSLIIPLPTNNSRGDQIQNSRYFFKKGMINMVEQELLTKNSFLLSVNNTYNNRKVLVNNINMQPVKDGSRNISNILADYA